MSGYTQLTQEERYQIYILKKAEYSQAQIAGLLERGISGARDEFLLAATAQNLRRMAKLLSRPPPIQGMIAPG